MAKASALSVMIVCIMPVLTAAAARAAPLADFCNSFHLPIISFVDEPGFISAPTANKAPSVTARHIFAVLQAACPGLRAGAESFGVAAATA